MVPESSLPHLQVPAKYLIFWASLNHYIFTYTIFWRFILILYPHLRRFNNPYEDLNNIIQNYKTLSDS
jgi:hypothetical protein